MLSQPVVPICASFLARGGGGVLTEAEETEGGADGRHGLRAVESLYAYTPHTISLHHLTVPLQVRVEAAGVKVLPTN